MVSLSSLQIGLALAIGAVGSSVGAAGPSERLQAELTGRAVFIERGKSPRHLTKEDKAAISLDFDTDLVNGDRLVNGIQDGKWTANLAFSQFAPVKVRASMTRDNLFSEPREALLAYKHKMSFQATLALHTKLSWIENLLRNGRTNLEKIATCPTTGNMRASVDCARQRSKQSVSAIEKLRPLIVEPFSSAVRLAERVVYRYDYADALLRLGNVCDAYRLLVEKSGPDERSQVNAERFMGFSEATIADFLYGCIYASSNTHQFQLRRAGMALISTSLLAGDSELMTSSNQTGRNSRNRVFRTWLDLFGFEVANPNDQRSVAQKIVDDGRLSIEWRNFVNAYTLHGGTAFSPKSDANVTLSQLAAIRNELATEARSR